MTFGFLTCKKAQNVFDKMKTFEHSEGRTDGVTVTPPLAGLYSA